jgi:hypothetical protein
MNEISDSFPAAGENKKIFISCDFDYLILSLLVGSIFNAVRLHTPCVVFSDTSMPPQLGLGLGGPVGGLVTDWFVP